MSYVDKPVVHSSDMLHSMQLCESQKQKPNQKTGFKFLKTENVVWTNVLGFAISNADLTSQCQV